MEKHGSTSANASKGRYFEPRRLGHVNLYVADLDATMEFYTKTVGIEEVYRTPLAGGGFVSNGNTHHDIGFIEAFGPVGKARSAKPGQLNHLAFELEHETALVAAYKKAARDGYEFVATMNHDIAHSIYNSDPEGNRYELYADVVKDWRSQRRGTVTKPKPTWSPGSTPPVDERCYDENPIIRRVEEALFHPKRTTHATLIVNDLESAVEHYTAIAGLQVLSRGSDNQLAVCAGTCGEPSLVLIQSSGTRRAGFHHVGMRAENSDDLEQSVRRARSVGFPLRVDMTHSGRRAIFIRDPDGFLVQIYSDQDGGPELDSLSADLALYCL